jgi:hypothetical protein
MLANTGPGLCNPYYIGRKQIACKLYPLEGAVYASCKPVGEGGLAHPRNVLYEQVAPCKQCRYGQVYNIGFATDYLFDVVFKSLYLFVDYVIVHLIGLANLKFYQIGRPLVKYTSAVERFTKRSFFKLPAHEAAWT